MPFITISGTTLHGSLIDLAGTLGAVAIAAVALHAPPLKPLAKPIEALRTMHTGVFTDYVVWIVVGVAIYGAFLVPIAAFAAR
jgi:hypothetical protein